MKRRTFLKASSALPLFFGGLPLSLFSSHALANQSDNVLVLLQLAGGNDGLNMVLPLDQYHNLAGLRENILIPEQHAIQLGANTNAGLHPAMQSLKGVWDSGQLQIIQGVGYPNQNRSHFRSQDIWNTGSDASEFLSTGWLGRYIEQDNANYPFGYPNQTQPDPLALTVGNQVSPSCQGTLANFSLSVVDPFNPGTLQSGIDAPLKDNHYGEELGFIQNIVKQTNGYASTIESAANSGNNLSSRYHENGFNYVSESLKTVARLISGGLKTKIYVVQMGGFDTHEAQVLSNDTTQGTHANLLATLSDAIAAFQDDLVKLGIADRVIGMTCSEFGRRIRSNASLGTDHGSAAPHFLFGSSINAGIVGQNPIINANATIEEGVAMQHDFRNIYGTILQHHFGCSTAQIKDLLFNDYNDLPLIKVLV